MKDTEKDSRPQASDAATLAYYQRTAEIYRATGPGGTSRHLPGFLGRLPFGARILDLGCGGGRDAEGMLAAGFDVLACDASAEVAARAEARLGFPVQVMRFEELAEEEAYDAIWASASLLHVPRTVLADVLARIHAALRPGGWHFASYKAGSGAARDPDGRYYNYLSEAELVAAYRSAGRWNIEEVLSYTGGGYPGGRGPWLAVTLRRDG